ncbi:MAG: DUF6916 family protein [Aestuariibacter sp.]
MSNFTYDILIGMVGERLKIVNNDNIDASLTITEVLESRNETKRFEAFSVLYKGDESFQLTDGEFTLFHEKLGTERVFIYQHSPVDYQTSISRERVAQE